MSELLPRVAPPGAQPIDTLSVGSPAAPVPAAPVPVNRPGLDPARLSQLRELLPQQLESERHTLQAERELLEAGTRGVTRAQQMVAEAQLRLQSATATGAQPSPSDQQQLLTTGARLAQVGELTQARGLYPLREPAALRFPHGEIPSYTLMGDGPEALVPTAPFMPGTDPQQAQNQLMESQQRLSEAHAAYQAQQKHLDRVGLAAVEAEQEQSAARFNGGPLPSLLADPTRLAAARHSLDAATATRLLAPDTL